MKTLFAFAIILLSNSAFGESSYCTLSLHESLGFGTESWVVEDDNNQASEEFSDVRSAIADLKYLVSQNVCDLAAPAKCAIVRSGVTGYGVLRDQERISPMFYTDREKAIQFQDLLMESGICSQH